ncbi:MAG: hypothetical protein AAFV01_14485, partial [Bacteroidota bacterium]
MSGDERVWVALGGGSRFARAEILFIQYDAPGNEVDRRAAYIDSQGANRLSGFSVRPDGRAVAMTDQGQVITLDPAGILTVSPRDEEFDAHAFTTDEEAATLIGIRDRQVIARRIRYNGSTAWTSVVEEFPEGLQQNFQFTAAQ